MGTSLARGAACGVFGIGGHGSGGTITSSDRVAIERPWRLHAAGAGSSAGRRRKDAGRRRKGAARRVCQPPFSGVEEPHEHRRQPPAREPITGPRSTATAQLPVEEHHHGQWWTTSRLDLLALGQTRLLGNYRQAPIVLERGRGSELWDTDGRRYLDLCAGVAVSSLGHAHPRLAAAIADQAGALIHASNYFYNAENVLPRRRALRAPAATTAPSSATPAPRPTRRCSSWRAASSMPAGRRSATASSPSTTRSTAGRWAPSASPATPSTRGLRPAARRASPTWLRRPRRRARRHGPRRGRDHRRARPGRGRRARAAAGLPRRRCGASPTSTARSSSSTRCRPASAAPAAGSGRITTAFGATPSRSPRGSPEASPSAPCW